MLPIGFASLVSFGFSLIGYVITLEIASSAFIPEFEGILCYLGSSSLI